MLVSVCIPAYAKPQLLVRAIESLFAQEHRPIEILVSDDSSPQPLEAAALELLPPTPDGISMRWLRRESNVGPYRNGYSLLDHALGDVLVFFPHDDFMIDKNFLRRACQLMSENERLNAVIGNSALELDDPFWPTMMSGFSPGNDFLIVSGDEYVARRLFSGFHPAYSAVAIRMSALQGCGFRETEVDWQICDQVGVDPDEGYLGLIGAACLGDVAITLRVVSVRGNPDDSYSKSEFWQRNGHAGLHLQYLNAIAIENAAYAQIGDFLTTVLIANYPLPRWYPKLWGALPVGSRARRVLVKSLAVGLAHRGKRFGGNIVRSVAGR